MADVHLIRGRSGCLGKKMALPRNLTSLRIWISRIFVRNKLKQMAIVTTIRGKGGCDDGTGRRDRLPSAVVLVGVSLRNGVNRNEYHFFICELTTNITATLHRISKARNHINMNKLITCNYATSGMISRWKREWIKCDSHFFTGISLIYEWVRNDFCRLEIRLTPTSSFTFVKCTFSIGNILWSSYSAIRTWWTCYVKT